MFQALSYVPRSKISYLPSIPHGDGKRWCLTMRINNTPIPHDNLTAINRGELCVYEVPFMFNETNPPPFLLKIARFQHSCTITFTGTTTILKIVMK